MVIQDTQKLRPKDNKEANLGILEHFGHKNLGILELMRIFAPTINLYYYSDEHGELSQYWAWRWP